MGAQTVSMSAAGEVSPAESFTDGGLPGARRPAAVR